MLEELKKYLQERIEDTEVALNSFDPNDGYDYEIGACEGTIDAFREILVWIDVKEEK